MSANTHTLHTTISKVLRPLVRLLLRHGVAYADFANWVKRIYVDVAENEFALEGKKQSVSRISVLTGLNRKEVSRLQGLPQPESQPGSQHNRAARVISGWLRDERFLDDHGEPAPLPLNDDTGFPALIKQYSGDMPTRAVLDELERVGVVTVDDANHVLLNDKAYVPHESDAAMMGLAGDSIRDLIETIDYNLRVAPSDSRIQLSVVYDNLSPDTVEQLRHMSRNEAHTLLLKLDKYLSSRDRDTSETPSPAEETGRYRAGVGIYYFEDTLDEGSANEKRK